MLACCFRGPIPRRVLTVQARRAPLRGGRALHCRAARRRGPHGLGSEPRFVLSLLGDWLQGCLRQSRSQPCVGLARRVHTVCSMFVHWYLIMKSMLLHCSRLPTGPFTNLRCRQAVVVRNGVVFAFELRTHPCTVHTPVVVQGTSLVIPHTGFQEAAFVAPWGRCRQHAFVAGRL